MENNLKQFRKKITIFTLMLFSILLIMDYILTNRAEKKYSKCSMYSIATPIRMPDSHKVYYYFYYNGKKIEDSESVGATDLGWHYTEKDILSKKHLVQIVCNEPEISKILWEWEVIEDSVISVPQTGWKELPLFILKKRI